MRQDKGRTDDACSQPHLCPGCPYAETSSDITGVMAILAAPTCTRLGILGLRDHELLSRQVQLALAQLRARLRSRSIRHGTLLQRKYGQPRRQS